MRIAVIDIETKKSENAKKMFEPFEYRVRAGKSEGVFAQVNKIKSITEEKAALSPITGELLCVGVNILEYLHDAPIAEEWIGPEWHFLPVIEGVSELSVLANLNVLIANCDYLVTYNGRSFDFPFLAFRAVMNDIILKVPNGARYNGYDNHIDLALHLQTISNLEGLDSYSFNMYPVKLEAWIKFFQIPIHKPSIATGEINLESLMKSGGWNEIEAYSKGDVDATTIILQKVFHTITFKAKFANY